MPETKGGLEPRVANDIDADEADEEMAELDDACLDHHAPPTRAHEMRFVGWEWDTRNQEEEEAEKQAFNAIVHRVLRLRP